MRARRLSVHRLASLGLAALSLPGAVRAALPNPPKEDIHFLAEHVPEAAQDARYLTLPWLAERLTPGKWQATVQAGGARSEVSFYRIQGPMLAVSAGTGLSERWGIEGLAFYDSMTVSGGSGIEALAPGGLRNIPLDLPEMAEFSHPRGDYRHFGAGVSLVRELSPAQARGRWTLKLGLLYDHLEIKNFQADYRLLGGANAGARGVIDHSSQADFVTPYLAAQRTIPIGTSWELAPRLVIGAPLPAGKFDERLSGPGFDRSTTRGGEGKAGQIGDGFSGLSAGLLHRASGLEIDLGGTLFYPLVEKLTHPGVDKALLLQLAWHIR